MHPELAMRLRFRHHTGEGRDVGSANYKARLNLRVSSATAAKLRDRRGKGNKRHR